MVATEQEDNPRAIIDERALPWLRTQPGGKWTETALRNAMLVFWPARHVLQVVYLPTQGVYLRAMAGSAHKALVESALKRAFGIRIRVDVCTHNDAVASPFGSVLTFDPKRMH